MSSSKICMNGLCGAKTTPQWKRGWPMKAGGFATLCYSCGIAYENVTYCERFHLNEPGWRECKFCEKPVHCGCVVSKYLHECLDLGGISCIKCIRSRGTQALKPIQSYPTDIPNGFIPFSATWHPSVMGNRINGGATLEKGKLTHLTESIEKHQHQPSPSTPSFTHQIKQDEKRVSSSKEVSSTIFPSASSLFGTPDHNGRTDLGLKALYEAIPPQPSLSYSLGNNNNNNNALTTSTKSIVAVPNATGVVDGREAEKVASFKQGQRSRVTFPKPSKTGSSSQSQRSQSNKGAVSENRVARPPAEGRGRNQLLPRYWPKITDQELLQISGDLNSNCTITPLFEKVLSASDAGRIGRLVLPKACAEAYFPAINQSEGLPIRIQDIKGKEWTFQFRFWPNNNSRMYVLEGVTPCIQNMQLQAGDTVIFSRLDPGEKLVIGCRKATISADTPEGETAAMNGVAGGNGSTPTKNMEQEGGGGMDSVVVQRGGGGGGGVVIQEKKKTRNIGSKNKRLLMHNEDAMELKVTWEEAHELLRPPPTSTPTVSMIENCEFEEYDEPPVFGKKTIFTAHASGSQEQWGQCDSCSKWRKLPPDVLLPSKWTCSDNVWDPDRCSCSVPDEINTRDLERIFKFGKDLKKRKHPEGRAVEEQEPSGLDALATAAVLGESIGGEFGESSAGPTTRHPRHRPGCTCIVCIQPPSGKGKHKPNCFCNVCLTVKRRFKTLMLRKKKRLSDREAEVAQKALESLSNGTGIGISGRNGIEVEVEVEVGESSGKGGQRLDLNCDPDKEEEMTPPPPTTTATTDASVIPLEWQHVLAGLVPCSLPPKGTSEMEVEGHSSSLQMPPTDETPTPAPMVDAVEVEVEVEEKVVQDR